MGGRLIKRLPNFHEQAPWWGGDLQTIRNFLKPFSDKLPGKSQQIIFSTSDGSGDQLMATLDMPEVCLEEAPLIILIHGLGGSEDSSYMRATSAYHLNLGRRVLRLNLRGAGPSEDINQKHYHGGHIDDLIDVLGGMDRVSNPNSIFLIGFSLGGNILVNFLAETNFPIILGAATVSASIDPEKAAKQLLKPRNYFYQAWLLHHMKKESLKRSERLNDKYKNAIKSAKTIYQFDDQVTARQNNYKDAADYYYQTAGMRKVDKIAAPLLMINARNDPWIPSEPYGQVINTKPDNIEVLLPNGGGHVGFHQKGSETTWHDDMINEFLAKL